MYISRTYQNIRYFSECVKVVIIRYTCNVQILQIAQYLMTKKMKIKMTKLRLRLLGHNLIEDGYD